MTLKIQAAVFREAGCAPTIEALTIDTPRAGEVLVAIRAVGVCHTDMVMRGGHLPIPRPVVLGHKGSGVIVALGPDVTVLTHGNHVVLSFDSCGDCVVCKDDVELIAAICSRITSRAAGAMVQPPSKTQQACRSIATSLVSHHSPRMPS